jgi:alkylation response protein AidB-like acyl-CoA dehydrogenase
MFHFTDEQRMIQEMVGRLAKEKITPFVEEADRAGHSLPQILQILAENGLLKLGLPEKYGGIGADYTTIALVVEEMAKVDASTAISRF